MIEIKCSKREQQKIIAALSHGTLPCIFPRKSRHCTNDLNMTCKKVHRKRDQVGNRR